MGILEDWGWDARWAEAFGADAAKGLFPARLVEEQRGLFQIMSAKGVASARTTGNMRHKAEGRADLPAVGDWIAAEFPPHEKVALIRRILPRRTKLSRKAAGDVMMEQVIAANLDAVLVMTALNAEFNPRRLERFLTVSRESGAEPVLVLNKLDACPDAAALLEQARSIAGDAAVIAVSAKTGAGLEALNAWIKPGRTVGLVGSSGVGKSTLVNRLAGNEKIKTAETRSTDERGRHTTTHRQLFVLPGGGILLDTPGMREMQFWEADQGLAKTFDEIEALAPNCRFKDCAHAAEPGCAVKAAVAAGTVLQDRIDAWRKLKREASAEARRKDPAPQPNEKQQWKTANKAQRKRIKEKKK
ncbi:MAG: ribosome small subunit-dependent GTPase A [Elusimicrobia bacterium]|nr:ribosome small subunit-dependent GTPase A [Elusimicrobiota bacterium]